MLTALDTIWVPHPDYNQADAQIETMNLFSRQKAIHKLIEGKLGLTEVLDLLDDQGIDPSSYLEEVGENLHFLGW
jgi:hypothetical protein